MKTCSRLLNWIQIIDAEGDVRLCSWSKDNKIGNLLESDMDEILNGEKAKELRRLIAEGNYCNCPADNCPYLSNGKIDDVLVEYGESVIQKPESLLLAYEGNCNYDCTCCSSYSHMMDTRKNDYTEYYNRLEEKIRDILPGIKMIGANGRGELFASPRIMKILSEWEPTAPVEECSVELESNGSLFNERNWKKIENLGKYNLSVYITIMSFDELTYQYLSGTKLPIKMLEENLRFIKSLRESGVINYLELATVLQELNFREMPEFVHRCIYEFGADKVRLRPILPAERMTREEQWISDVRNPKHPYNCIFKKVMGDPIFSDPKVLLWSNNLPSKGTILADSTQTAIINRVKGLVEGNGIIEKIASAANNKKIALYGLGLIGKVLTYTLKDRMEISMIIDKAYPVDEYLGIPVRTVENISDYKGAVIITPYNKFNEMKQELLHNGFTGEIYDLGSFFD